ncbi:hypothetical protein FOMG_16883 [Fusarium oxysporum f. sp. melonis 26406]|uniref:Uncharacterized protein n=1 Tax=Fusarium oxysporum f. sp. melonis 26406 TaxID=1089452 RepID=W9Z464_FUSOX|nr:hypothetical protein FOMG_16883 [Fusarium oxysporum f. sp. melonis 26406]
MRHSVYTIKSETEIDLDRLILSRDELAEVVKRASLAVLAERLTCIRLKSHGEIWSDTNPGQPDRRLSSKVRNTSHIQKLHAYGKYS